MTGQGERAGSGCAREACRRRVYQGWGSRTGGARQLKSATASESLCASIIHICFLCRRWSACVNIAGSEPLCSLVWSFLAHGWYHLGQYMSRKKWHVRRALMVGAVGALPAREDEVWKRTQHLADQLCPCACWRSQPTLPAACAGQLPARLSAAGLAARRTRARLAPPCAPAPGTALPQSPGPAPAL